jgi:hypothetical protein
MSKNEWIRYFKELSTKHEEEPSISAATDQNEDPITAEDLTETTR